MTRRMQIGLVVLAMLLEGCSMGHHGKRSIASGEVPPPLSPTVAANDLTRQWGIESHGVRLTAAGYMLDFRYRVLDPQLAAPLLDRRVRAYVEVQKSDARLTVPVSAKVGALRSTTRHPLADRNYFIMFSNPGRHVQPGDRVSVVIGDFRTDPITVM